MAAAIAKAKKAGATAETMVNFGSGEMSLGEAITKAGMDVEEFFEGTGKQNEVVEFVKSMYDETTGNFPKGETGVLLAVAKLSKPLNKDFTKEALIRVKLDF